MRGTKFFSPTAAWPALEANLLQTLMAVRSYHIRINVVFPLRFLVALASSSC